MKTLPEKTAERPIEELFVEKYFGLVLQKGRTHDDFPINADYGQLVNLLTMFKDEYAALRSEQDRKEIERLKEQRDEAMRDNDRQRDKYDKLNFNMNEDWQKLTGRIKELEEALREAKQHVIPAYCSLRERIDKALTKESAPSKEIEELKKEKL